MSIDNVNPQIRTTNEKPECQKGTAHSTKNIAQQIMHITALEAFILQQR